MIRFRFCVRSLTRHVRSVDTGVSLRSKDLFLRKPVSLIPYYFEARRNLSLSSAVLSWEPIKKFQLEVKHLRNIRNNKQVLENKACGLAVLVCYVIMVTW